MLSTSPKGTLSWMRLSTVPTTAESSAQPKMMPLRPHALCRQLETVGLPPSIRSAAANTTATPKKVVRNMVSTRARPIEMMKLICDVTPAAVSRPPSPPPMMISVAVDEPIASTGSAAMPVS